MKGTLFKTSVGALARGLSKCLAHVKTRIRTIHWPKLGMKPNDWITATLAAAALSLSGYTFYSTEVEVKDDLQLRIVEWGVREPPQEGVPNKLGVTVAIVNAGNRQAILLDSKLTLRLKDKPYGLGYGGEEATSDLPKIIEPKRIVLLTPQLDVSYPAFFIGKTAPDASGHWLYTLTLELTALDSAGRMATTALPVETVDFDKQLHHTFLPTESLANRLLQLLPVSH
jgi:hypothetical protein